MTTGKDALTLLNEATGRGADPTNIVDHQQRRGMALDIIDEALNKYREFMLDDDYNAQRALDQIMTRMSERRSALS